MSIIKIGEIEFVGGQLHGQWRDDNGADFFKTLVKPKEFICNAKNGTMACNVSAKVETYKRQRFVSASKVVFYVYVLKGLSTPDVVHYLETGKMNASALSKGEV